ncbi:MULTISPECIES: hypothetical protein [Alphaproteobacteria]|uniref:hypothetical protein n=1 Tax=Alphaproteobacteria TaxID=28211 RepID=UPI0011BD5326|nr:MULTISPECIES: hypothetical protein [Alphaproteobacteria]
MDFEGTRDAVDALMGTKPEARFRFIQDRAAFADNLDIWSSADSHRTLQPARDRPNEHWLSMNPDGQSSRHGTQQGGSLLPCKPIPIDWTRSSTCALAHPPRMPHMLGYQTNRIREST